MLPCEVALEEALRTQSVPDMPSFPKEAADLMNADLQQIDDLLRRRSSLPVPADPAC